MGQKSAQRQFLVKVSGIDGHFATKSGGNITAETNKVYDGGSKTPDVISAPPEAENVTVGRAYDEQRDGELVVGLRQKVGSWRTTVSITPTDADLVAQGTPLVYPDALLVGLTEPEVDAGGSDAAVFELEFAVGTYR